jgi:hypothetical protein
MSDAVQFIRSGNGLPLNDGVAGSYFSKFVVWYRIEEPPKVYFRLADHPDSRSRSRWVMVRTPGSFTPPA